MSKDLLQKGLFFICQDGVGIGGEGKDWEGVKRVGIKEGPTWKKDKCLVVERTKSSFLLSFVFTYKRDIFLYRANIFAEE